MTKVPCLFPLSTNLVPGNCFKSDYIPNLSQFNFNVNRHAPSGSTIWQWQSQTESERMQRRRPGHHSAPRFLATLFESGFFFYLSLLPDLLAAAGRGRGVCVQNSIRTPRHLRYLRYLRHLHELASEELYRAGGWRTFLAVIGVFYLREYDNQIRRDRLGSGLLGAGRLLRRKRRQSLVSLFKPEVLAGRCRRDISQLPCET